VVKEFLGDSFFVVLLYAARSKPLIFREVFGEIKYIPETSESAEVREV
jgi:hypothetical protein